MTAIPPHPLRRIVTGGQTGVDRAALDAAQQAGLAVGGWCPAGRRAEDGPLDGRYPLQETPSAAYAQRTQWNVRDSDGTLLLLWGPVTGGTALTLADAQRRHRPWLVVDLAKPLPPHAVRAWAAQQGVQVLNIAGPRESEAPGVYGAAHTFLAQVFQEHAPAGPQEETP